MEEGIFHNNYVDRCPLFFLAVRFHSLSRFSEGITQQTTIIFNVETPRFRLGVGILFYINMKEGFSADVS
jgi:hypothetical protein